MKRIISTILIFILIFSMIAQLNIVYATGVDLMYYFQANMLFTCDCWTEEMGYFDNINFLMPYLNESYYWDYDDGGPFNYGKYDFSNDTGTNVGIYYKWMYYLKDLLDEINSEDVTYEDIANSNSAEDIEYVADVLQFGLRIVVDTCVYKGQYVSRSNEDRDTWKDVQSLRRSRAALDNITGYNAEEFGHYLDEAVRKLHAAHDFATGASTYKTQDGDAVSVAHDTDTKFLYNFDQICHYLLKVYGDNLDVNGEDANISNVWYPKLGLYKRINEDGETDLLKYGKALTRTDIKCDPSDTYAQKMKYDLEQIWVYIQAFGYNTGLTGAEDSIVKLEWANMIENGEHTEFFNKNITVSSSSGNKTFIGTTDASYTQSELSHATTVINSVENLKQDGEEYAKEHQNDFSDKFSTAEYEKAIAESLENGNKKNDSDANKTFKLPLNLGNASTGNGIDDAIGDAEKLVTATSETKSVFSEGDLADFSNSIYNILLSVGIVIAVVVGMILGIKLMLAPVAERAEAKKLLIPYGIGCAIIFGAFGIWKLAVIILQNV